MTKKLTTEEFIKKAKKIHGNRYDYSKVEYIDNITEVIIICDKHSEFPQIPKSHLQGKGCRSCGYNQAKKKTRSTTAEFVKKAKKIHGNRYDYSMVNYIDAKTEVIIICSIHGEFNQTPNHHLAKKGCSDCGNELRSKKRRLTKEDFIERGNDKYENKYNYSKLNYIDLYTEVIIICPIHGEFDQTPHGHLYSGGCYECGRETVKINSRDTVEMFIDKAKKIYGDKYDYSRVHETYINSKSEVKIGCPIHSWFDVIANAHLRNECGKCINKAEGKIAEFLESKFITFRNYKIKNFKKYYDYYLPDFNLIIERDGEQHYYDVEFFSRGDEDYLKKQQENDRYKTELAKKHGYKIARIPYWLNDEQVEREIDNILAGNPSYPDVPDLKQAETKPLPK